MVRRNISLFVVALLFLLGHSFHTYRRTCIRSKRKQYRVFRRVPGFENIVLLELGSYWPYKNI